MTQDRCPTCGAEIDRSAVTSRVEDRLGTITSEMDSLKSEQKVLSAAKGYLTGETGPIQSDGSPPPSPTGARTRVKFGN